MAKKFGPIMHIYMKVSLIRMETHMEKAQ
jgi:hypothetical protein